MRGGISFHETSQYKRQTSHQCKKGTNKEKTSKMENRIHDGMEEEIDLEAVVSPPFFILDNNALLVPRVPEK